MGASGLRLLDAAALRCRSQAAGARRGTKSVPGIGCTLNAFAATGRLAFAHAGRTMLLIQVTLRCHKHTEENTMVCRSFVMAALCATLISSPAWSQEKKKAPPARPAPTEADFVYAKDHDRQKFDFWQAKS